MSKETRSKSVDAVLNRVEVAKASRNLQARLRLASYKARNGLVSTPIDSIARTSAMPPPRTTTPSLRYANGSPRIGNALFKSPKRNTNTRKLSSNYASPDVQHDSESMNAANALTSLFHSPGYKPSNSTAPTPPPARNPDESDAQLMLFLATSPSPAKPETGKQARQTASPRYSNLDFTQWIHSPRDIRTRE